MEVWGTGGSIFVSAMGNSDFGASDMTTSSKRRSRVSSTSFTRSGGYSLDGCSSPEKLPQSKINKKEGLTLVAVLGTEL